MGKFRGPCTRRERGARRRSESTKAQEAVLEVTAAKEGGELVGDEAGERRIGLLGTLEERGQVITDDADGIASRGVARRVGARGACGHRLGRCERGSVQFRCDCGAPRVRGGPNGQRAGPWVVMGMATTWATFTSADGRVVGLSGRGRGHVGRAGRCGPPASPPKLERSSRGRATSCPHPRAPFRIDPQRVAVVAHSRVDRLTKQGSNPNRANIRHPTSSPRETPHCDTPRRAIAFNQHTNIAMPLNPSHNPL